ncbi:sporulation membrane protein YtaF [Cohnella endophytica]|uniref:Sporulation membrane protein YtaF n=1 Tax=Cohnella endophytica TaxID=2419778 RepID=A0A494XYK5_9BACL|nr:sporulation membrane protein YtaF [Cohnella endophytica]RKP55592.1 sporulation membrane protein YtaF [Cohnella endophytica]
MAPVASLVLLSVAVSLDGFGVGITYGIRKIKIPISSIAIISACSGLIILLSMMVGVAISQWMPPKGASAVGAIILMGIGAAALLQFIRNGRRESSEGRPSREEYAAASEHASSRPEEPVLKMELKVFGFIIQILRTPSAADRDRSGTISAGEAFFLGLALSLDAFGAGIGAALLGFPPPLTALLIALASGLFLLSGTRVGFWASDWRWVKTLSVMPGIILILMGIFKLFL